MSPRSRPGRKFLKALLPIVLLLIIAVMGLVAWLVYGASRPPRRAYLVTPERFALLSDRGLKATDETWTNRDGTRARGWLLRGAEGAPAVVLLHRYGADRSWFLNLGVKLNEATNFTILWPDQRGHGETPPVEWSSFGAREAEDVQSAIDYLRTLKTGQGRALVGANVGLYGVELGAYAALLAASHDPAKVKSLVLDSVPASPGALLSAVVKGHTGLDNDLLGLLTSYGAHVYFLGGFENTAACEAATTITNSNVLLLTGQDAGYLRDSTVALARCFPNQSKVEAVTDLPLTGFNLASAPGAQGEAYDRHMIDFFDHTLR